MRRITLGCAIACLLVSMPVLASWSNLQIVPTSEYDYGPTTLAFDAESHPCVFYSGTWNPVPRVTFNDGDAWITRTVDTAGYAEQRAMALDGSGRPHVLYTDLTDYQHPILKYAYWDGSAFCRETIGSGYGFLKLDSEGHPHILYSDEATTGLKYTVFDGSSWVTQTVDSSVAAGAAGLALDSDDNPHILSYEGSWPDTTALKYGRFDGSSWAFEYVAGADAHFADLVLDASDNPRVAYRSASYELMYASKQSGSWAWELVNSYGGDYSSLALDPDGNPCITHEAYYTENPTLRVNFARRTSTGWVEDMIGEGSYTSLAFDGEGVAHATYADYNSPGGLIYATIPEPGSLLVLGSGLLGLAGVLWKRR